jgi:steroid 5-alpha reductase family enzyme
MSDPLAVLAITWAACTLVITGLWLYGVTHDNDLSLIDGFYGVASLLFGGLTFVLWHEKTARGATFVVAAGVWAFFLGRGMFLRWLKTLHAEGGDARYRDAAVKLNIRGRNFWWKSYLCLVAPQVLLISVLNLPLQMVIMSDLHGLSVLDGLGLVVAVAGSAVENVSNWQLELFKRDPANKGRTLMTGLWAWSRHPNYFGNTIVYFGFFIAAIRDPTLWWTVVSPVTIFLVLRIVFGVRQTDVMMLEKRRNDPVYLDYVARVSPFVLRAPRRLASTTKELV